MEVIKIIKKNLKIIFLMIMIIIFLPSYISATIINLTSSSGTWTVPTGVTTIKVLVVAGGGSGGSGLSGYGSTGGGGAGGVVYNSSYPVTAGSNIPYKVGAGGLAPNANTNLAGNNGTNSSFGTINVRGGGGGGSASQTTHSAGQLGGSGGGAGQWYAGTAPSGGAGTTNQGNSGGNGAGGTTNNFAGGGGGKNTSGSSGSGQIGGKGGRGYNYSSIFGTSYGVFGCFAGGGGGGGNTGAGNGSCGSGLGAKSGGGSGKNATARTGSGGGGMYATSTNKGGNGGSGIIIIIYNATSSSNYSITAKSSYNNSAISTFSVTAVNGSTTRNYNSSGGSVAKWLSTDTRKYNITCKNVPNYHDKTYLNYQFSVSGNLECLMNKKGAYIQFYTKDNSMTEKARITSSGFLGLGTTSPQYMIHVNSTTDGNILALQDTDGLCLHNPESASETVTCSSDKILKKDIHDTNIKGVETISKYRIKDFTLVASGQVRTGVIAQELQQTMPDKVKNIDGILMVELPNLWTLAKAIQELSDSQNNLNNQISTLQNANNILTSQLTEANTKILTMQTDIETMKTQICTINRNCPKIQTQSLAMTTNTTNSTELI